MPKKWLQELLDLYEGNETHAAKSVGISRQRLRYLMDAEKNFDEVAQVADRARRVLKHSKSAMYDKLVGK